MDIFWEIDHPELADEFMVKIGQSNFKILCRQYQNFMTVLYFWIIILIAILLSDTLLLLTQNRIIVLATIILSGIALSIFEFKRNITALFQILTLTTNIFLFCCFLILYFKIHNHTFLFCLATITLSAINFIAVLRYMRNVNLIIAVLCLGFQEYMVVSGLSQQNMQGMFSTISILVFLFCIGLASALSVIAALAIFSCIESEYLSRWNVAGMSYISLLLLSLSALIFSPIGLYLLQWSLFDCLKYSLLINPFVIGFSIYFQKQIVVFMCDAPQITKETQQPIWTQISPEQLQKMKFKLISQNYCSSVSYSEINTQCGSLNKDSDHIDLGQCLVCCEYKSQILGKPCGHIAICLDCCCKLFGDEQFSCILCKQTLLQIYQMKTSISPQLQKLSSSCLIAQKGYRKI